LVPAQERHGPPGTQKKPPLRGLFL
jgi:hypothetical protein